MATPTDLSPSENHASALALMRTLADVARADGEVSPRERRLLRGVGSAYGLSADDIDLVLARGPGGHEAPDAADLTVAERVTVLRGVISVMHGDRVVAVEELGALRRYASGLGVPEARVDDFVDFAMTSRQSGLHGEGMSTEIEGFLG